MVSFQTIISKLGRFLVFEVLFNPYTGDMILMREEWSSVCQVWNKKPKLIPRHIPHNESDQYQVIPTAEPQGCVFQKVDTEIVEGELVNTHLGKLIRSSFLFTRLFRLHSLFKYFPRSCF